MLDCGQFRGGGDIEDNESPLDLTFAGVIHAKVERWLAREGWKVEERGNDNVIWGLMAEDRHKRRILISQQPGHEDRVILEARVVPTAEQAKAMLALPEWQARDLMWDLRLELSRMGIDFQGLSLPMKRVVLTEALYFEGALDSTLAKDTFFQRVEHLRRGIAMVQFLLRRRLVG